VRKRVRGVPLEKLFRYPIYGTRKCALCNIPIIAIPASFSTSLCGQVVSGDSPGLHNQSLGSASLMSGRKNSITGMAKQDIPKNVSATIYIKFSPLLDTVIRSGSIDTAPDDESLLLKSWDSR